MSFAVIMIAGFASWKYSMASLVCSSPVDLESCYYLPVHCSEINWYKEEQQVLYRASGRATSLHEVGRQGLPEGLIECIVIPYLRGRRRCSARWVCELGWVFQPGAPLLAGICRLGWVRWLFFKHGTILHMGFINV